MSKRNAFAANCNTCGTHVAAGAGYLAGKIGGRWATTCAAHSAAARPATARYSDDDGYDAMKDAACEAGTWQHRPSRTRRY
jgi:hypothetical protein